MDDEKLVINALKEFEVCEVFREIPKDRPKELFLVVESNGIRPIKGGVFDSSVTIYVHNASIKQLRETTQDIVSQLPEKMLCIPSVFNPAVDEFYKSTDPVDDSDRYNINLSFTICTTSK